MKNILDQEINYAGLREIKYLPEKGLGNVSALWTHSDGIKLYQLINSTEWHVNTSFDYPSISYDHPIKTFRDLRDIHRQYLEARQKDLDSWK